MKILIWLQSANFIFADHAGINNLTGENGRLRRSVDWNLIKANSGTTVEPKLKVDKYRANVFVSDRYVRTEIAVSVENKDLNNSESYNFGVKLDEYQFISSLVFRVGEHGKMSVGDVHLEKTAEKIFEKAVAEGRGAALTSKEPWRDDATFTTKTNVPPGEKVYIWLNYDMQLTRNRKHYDFSTNIFPYDAVDELEINVEIDENMKIDGTNTRIYWASSGRPENRREEDGFDLKKKSDKNWSYSFSKKNVKKQGFNDDLVVEYDLQRDQNSCGDIIVRNGYFVHYLAPEGLDSLPKNVVLTIDKSGSMGSTRMENAKSALITILDQLRAKDTFSIISFNNGIEHYDTIAQNANPVTI
jgi:hypothetical protein